MEGADIDRGGGNRRIWENHQSKMGDYYPATSLDPRKRDMDCFEAVEFIPRLCHISKWPGFLSYGFDLQPVETSKGQGNFIGNVIPGSPAHDAGLLQGDRIIEVNGVNVERETIQKVTQRINPKSSETTLLVVDRTTDQLFKDERKRISSDMPLVRKISTRPRVQKPSLRTHQPYYTNSHFLISHHTFRPTVRQPTAKYGPLPAKITCPYCYSQVITETSYRPGARAWIAVFSLACIGCDAGCCLLPFLLTDCQDVHHKCPKCGLELGTFKR